VYSKIHNNILLCNGKGTSENVHNIDGVDDDDNVYDDHVACFIAFIVYIRLYNYTGMPFIRLNSPVRYKTGIGFVYV